MSVDPMGLATHILLQCPHVHSDKQLPSCGSPTLPFVEGITSGTLVKVLHRVLHHVYPSVFYLQDCSQSVKRIYILI